MQYKISKQYARDSERLLAEFNALQDATLFIESKLLADESFKVKIIYRSFKDNMLLHEYNPSDMTALGERFSDDGLLPHTLYPYKVSALLHSKEIVIAQFIELNDSKIFIEKKLSVDAAVQEDITYHLSTNGHVVEAFNPEKSTTSQSSGSTQSNAFQPTPFSMAPRLGPHSWLGKKEDDKNEDK